MRKRLWIGVSLACLLMGAGATETNLGLGPIAGRTWNGWVKLKSGDTATISLGLQPDGETSRQSYADLVVTRDGHTAKYRGWVHESCWGAAHGWDTLSFSIVGERDVAITPENREEEARRDGKVLREKSLGLFVLSYKIKTDRKDPVGTLVGAATGFVEGLVGLITFDPQPRF